MYYKTRDIYRNISFFGSTDGPAELMPTLYTTRNNSTGPAFAVVAEVAKHKNRELVVRDVHCYLEYMLALYDQLVLVMRHMTMTDLEDTGHPEYSLTEIDNAINYNMDALFI